MVHFDRMKPYQGPPMVTWLTEPPRQATESPIHVQVPSPFQQRNLRNEEETILAGGGDIDAEVEALQDTGGEDDFTQAEPLQDTGGGHDAMTEELHDTVGGHVPHNRRNPPREEADTSPFPVEQLYIISWLTRFVSFCLFTRLDTMNKIQGKKVNYECSECSNTFQHKRSLVRHRQVDHGPELYAWCDRCDFKSTRNLRRHYRHNHEDHTQEVDVIPMETQQERVPHLCLASRDQSKETRRVTVDKDLGDVETWGEALSILHGDTSDGSRSGRKARPLGNLQQRDIPSARRVSRLSWSEGIHWTSPSASRTCHRWSCHCLRRPCHYWWMRKHRPPPREVLTGKPRAMFRIIHEEEEVSEAETVMSPQQEPAEPAAVHHKAAEVRGEELRPVHITPLQEILKGKVSRVTEVDSTVDYKGGVIVREHRLERVYDVQFEQRFCKK